MRLKKWVTLLFLSLAACSGNKPKSFTQWNEPFTEMDFVSIPAGQFLMGNPGSSNGSGKSDQIHNVKITHGIWMEKTEVTQEQWRKVMGNTELHPEKPSPFWGNNPNYPKVSISFYDAIKFCEKLQELSPLHHFRLPTEAEWEYACRAGTATRFSTGELLADSIACFNAEFPDGFSNPGTKPNHPQPVGSYRPNNWGLFDMHGNVFEWVSDWYAPYSSKTQINPSGPKNGNFKIIRGGSWYFSAEKAQSFYRMTHEPELWGFSIGFRIVIDEK